MAYREGGTLLGPEGDPEGWETIAPFTISGKLFETRSVEVEVSVSVFSFRVLFRTSLTYHKFHVSKPVSFMSHSLFEPFP